MHHLLLRLQVGAAVPTAAAATRAIPIPRSGRDKVGDSFPSASRLTTTGRPGGRSQSRSSLSSSPRSQRPSRGSSWSSLEAGSAASGMAQVGDGALLRCCLLVTA